MITQIKRKPGSLARVTRNRKHTTPTPLRFDHCRKSIGAVFFVGLLGKITAPSIGLCLRPRTPLLQLVLVRSQPSVAQYNGILTRHGHTFWRTRCHYSIMMRDASMIPRGRLDCST
jgi:hypothetical protein